MKNFIAALPMYDWPEERSATDAAWMRLRGLLGQAGIEAPEGLVRRNADMPPVPGGIRDAAGRVIAPDPASLPSDALDFPTLWRHPDLLLAQTCWGPMEQGLADQVTVAGQPSYEGVEGGQGIFYSSAIVTRNSEESVQAPDDGRAVIPLDLIRGKRLAYNSIDSMSGIIAPARDLEAMGESLAIFSARIETHAHRASIAAVAEGEADVAAIDCRSWAMARRHEPKAKDVRVVGWTARRKGLPMITSLHTPPGIVERLKRVLAEG